MAVETSGAAPAVSVVIACLNGAETLGETLDSLAAQEFDRPWEIVYADNGSTDGSQAIFAAFAARRPEIATQALDVSGRKGKPHALNAAVRAARGAGILFCDADDTLAPGYLTAMAAALERHPFVAARLDPYVLNEDFIREARPHPQETRLSLLPHAPHCNTAGGATLGFRREVFDVVGDFDPAYVYVEDTEYCVRAFLRGYELQLVPDAVYNYRYRENLDKIYRQNYNYQFYRALLRRQYVTDEPFLIPGRWLVLFRMLARQGLSYGVNRLLGRRQTPVDRARFSRTWGRLVGDLMGSLTYRVAPPGPGPAAEGKPARGKARSVWRRGRDRALRPLLGSLAAVSTSEKLIALTFDDGPDPASTPAVLEMLALLGMKATFFLVGLRAARHPELVARILAEGHEIGNHSWNHPVLPLLSSHEVAAQLRRTRAVLPTQGPRLMRPPYGAQSLRTRLLARRAGCEVVMWNVSGADWRADDAETLAGRIAGAAAPGAIVLLHDTLFSFEEERFRDRAPTIGALDLLARRLPDYRFVTVSELLRHGRPVRRYWAQQPGPAALAALDTAEPEAWRARSGTVG